MTGEVVNYRRDYSAYPEVVTQTYCAITVGGKERRIFHDRVKSAAALGRLAGLPAKTLTTIRIYGHRGAGLLHEEEHVVADKAAGKALGKKRLAELMLAYRRNEEEIQADLQLRREQRQQVIKESGMSEDECVALQLVAPAEDLPT